MVIDVSPERQAFIDDITNYTFIRGDGRLVLEPFCVYLSHCFGFDEKLHLAPQPIAVYALLLQLIHDRLGADEAAQKIERQGIIDWQPGLAYVFPEKRMTCIHIGALVHVSNDWIYAIGHTLAGLPEPESPSKYFAWADDIGYAVQTFINGYHNAFYKFQKQFDRAQIQRSGYSLFEALQLSRHKNIEYGAAVSELKARHQAYQAALCRMGSALESGFYLEAIALQECLFSNCLFNFLIANDITRDGASLHALLNEVSQHRTAAFDDPEQLLAQVDVWRKARNTAIHGFIQSTSQAYGSSGEDFQRASQATATTGLELCRLMVQWYEGECVNFVRHEFPLNDVNLDTSAGL
ncbi:hypothetical protein HU720_05030 [Pseudomonas sp. SWRI51]|uniref:hypothetical protein n=1 Tax=Pseudomonas sp. SWRI51 TaxID=2745491 RepID=UPI0016451D40|nr:hypothetical protein [Pseudomonas sp. SWRI51]MBC3410659.1 hypothetical protein [Pseudomonas sp. SWRI51]